MAKAVTNDDLNSIIADQLEAVGKKTATDDDYRRADCVAKLIGKQLKKDSLRLDYFTAQKKVPPRIDSLESAPEVSKGGRK
jgi:hypothetical protein